LRLQINCIGSGKPVNARCYGRNGIKIIIEHGRIDEFLKV